MKIRASHRRGFGVVEALIGAAIISVSLLALTSVAERLSRISNENTERMRGAYLLEEGLEAVRFMRDNSWGNLSSLNPATSYYLAYVNNAWVATTTPALVGGTHARTFRVSSVTRDANGRVAAAGTVDADTKEVVVKVEWKNHSATSTVQGTTYLAKIF